MNSSTLFLILLVSSLVDCPTKTRHRVWKLFMYSIGGSKYEFSDDVRKLLTLDPSLSDPVSCLTLFNECSRDWRIMPNTIEKSWAMMVRKSLVMKKNMWKIGAIIVFSKSLLFSSLSRYDDWVALKTFKVLLRKRENERTRVAIMIWNGMVEGYLILRFFMEARIEFFQLIEKEEASY